MAGPSGPLSGADVTQPPAGMAPSTRSKSGICLGVVWLVPESLRVVQAEVMPEQFAKALRVRLAPNEENSVNLRCLHWGWRATCIAAEQEWDRDWVTAQLEEGRKGRVSGRGSGAGEGERVSMPAMKVGPLQGGWREEAPSMQEKGKWRASPSPKAGPSKRARGEQAMGGPPGSAVYSPTSRAPIEQSADRSWLVAEAFLRHWVESLEWLLVACEEEVQEVQEERDGAQWELDRVWREWDLKLEVRTVHLQVRVEAAEVVMQQAGGSGAWENQQGSSAGEVRAAVERARQQEEWLANKVASGRRGVLYWAREHCILLNGALAALESIHDGLVRMPRDLLPELGQEVMQMGHLLAGHRWRATADPRAWWEMVTDMGELLPGQPEVLAMVVAQLEVFMVGRVAGLGLEEEEGSVALPVDQVLELAADYPGVKDLVNLVVILILDFDGERSAGALAREGDLSMLFKESNVEHRVEALQARRQVELVSMGGDLLEDLEWAGHLWLSLMEGLRVLRFCLLGSADLGGSAALGKSLLGGRDPLALVTEHSKTFQALMACADSRWDVIWTDPGKFRGVGLWETGWSWRGLGRRPYGRFTEAKE
ncbi:hypothetical protein E4T56_gene18483 [Termitomyces sp. T112]|nr:hypothetical protein E4T56_gene18483 [Termitomyces sp. T112]